MRKGILLIILLVAFTANAQEEACNCCTEAHAEFDFWVGTWNVTANGAPAGRNVIIKVQDNCAIQENWTSATPGYTGTSNNFYNAQTKQWEQIWIDNQGQSLHLKGNRIGNQMVLTSDVLINQQGEKYRNRITWTHNDDGTVRQLWEILDGDPVTSVAFNGLYTKEN